MVKESQPVIKGFGYWIPAFAGMTESV